MMRIGLRAPEGIIPTGRLAYNSESGMEYELFQDGSQFYVAACHEDVGLITWHYATAENWNDIIEGAN